MSDNILLVPKGFFGDIVLISPVIEALKASSQARRVSVVCSPSMVDMVRRDPLVDEAIPFDRKERYAGWQGINRFAAELSERGFSHAISFHRSPRTSYILRRAKIPCRIGFSDASLGWMYTERVAKEGAVHDVVRSLQLAQSCFSDDVKVKVAQLAQGILPLEDSFARLRVPHVTSEELSLEVREIVTGADPYVVVTPGSAWETKRWDVAGFRGVVRELTARGVKVVITGAPNEREVCDAVAAGLAVTNLCAQTSLFDLVALIQRAGAVVCNDSLAQHIASATQTPTVVVFCATSPRFGFGPWRNRAVVLEKEGLFCKPCHRHGTRSCPTGTRACMTGVSSADVLRALEQLEWKPGYEVRAVASPVSGNASVMKS